MGLVWWWLLPLLSPAAVFPSQVLVLRSLLSKAAHARLYLSGLLPLETPNLVQLNSHSTDYKTKAERCEQVVLHLVERNGLGRDNKIIWLLRCSIVQTQLKSQLLGKQLILEFTFSIQRKKKKICISSDMSLSLGPSPTFSHAMTPNEQGFCRVALWF